MKKIYFLSLFICACSAGLWLNDPAFASAPTPSTDSAFDAAAKALDKSKEEVQKLKEVWDKARLETTLYDQRAKRAYKKWAARGARAVKGTRDKAKEQKERAELEFQLAVERRKLAYNEWQASQLRMMARESQLKALDQDKDAAAIREKIKQLEDKIQKPSSVVRPSSSATPQKSSP